MGAVNSGDRPHHDVSNVQYYMRGVNFPDEKEEAASTAGDERVRERAGARPKTNPGPYFMRSRTFGSSCVVVTPFPLSGADPTAQMLPDFAPLWFGTLQVLPELYWE